MKQVLRHSTLEPDMLLLLLPFSEDFIVGDDEEQEIHCLFGNYLELRASNSRRGLFHAVMGVSTKACSRY